MVIRFLGLWGIGLKGFRVTGLQGYRVTMFDKYGTHGVALVNI